MNIDELIEKHLKIAIEYELYGRELFVSCIIYNEKYPLRELPPIRAVATTLTESINRASELWNKVKLLSEKCKIVVPPISEQPHNKGYHREFVFEDYGIEYKNIDNTFHITNVYRKTKDGWYYVDPPRPLTDEYKFEKNTPDGKMYSWNDIGILCGSAGEVLVDDNNMIVKQRTTIIS